jgi:hypothetical protein
MERPKPPDLEYILGLQPDFAPHPPLPEGSPGVRCFVFVPPDDPLPEGGPEVIQRHYCSWVNWIEQVSGFRVRAYPEVMELRLPWTAEL